MSLENEISPAQNPSPFERMILLVAIFKPRKLEIPKS